MSVQLRLFLTAFAIAAVALAGAAPLLPRPLAPSTTAKSLYPDWAHDHWVWLDNSISNQKNVTNMVDTYAFFNISVGAVDIDSMWSTGINNFVFDTTKFPNASGLFSWLHSQNIRVILWATSLVDTDSPNFQEGLQKGYFISKGETVKWWHGHGAFIDYTNPDALDWWHSQLDLVIDIGVDGFKCDGTDPYLFEFVYPTGFNGQFVSEREYADLYYRDFFYYTRSKNPNALIMSRPVDSFGPIYWDFSPRDVVWSGWVGDQDDTFEGLQNALRNMFESAWQNYVNFGSDIGGYRTPQNPRQQSLFLRWAQLDAFLPLMENGGGGNHFPWLFPNPDQTVAIYRTFVNLHLALKPYLLNAGNTAWYKNISVMKPLAEEVIIPYHSWDYMLWQDLFVAPIVEDKLQRTIDFPKGANWVYLFNQTVHAGGSSAQLTIPLSEFPVFQRQGSMLPLHVQSNDTPFGDSAQADCITLSIELDPETSSHHETSIRRWEGLSTDIAYTYTGGELTFEATPGPECFILLLHGIDRCPKAVRDDIVSKDFAHFESKEELDLLKEGAFCDPTRSFVRLGDGSKGHIVSLAF